MVEDVQAAAAALALESVGRVGHRLQFLEDELGHDQRPFEKTGFADLGDPAVDDDARVQDLVDPAAVFFPEKAEEVRRVEPFRLPRPDQEPGRGQKEKKHDPDEGGRARVGGRGLIGRAQDPAQNDAEKACR